MTILPKSLLECCARRNAAAHSRGLLRGHKTRARDAADTTGVELSRAGSSDEFSLQVAQAAEAGQPSRRMSAARHADDKARRQRPGNRVAIFRGCNRIEGPAQNEDRNCGTHGSTAIGR